MLFVDEVIAGELERVAFFRLRIAAGDGAGLQPRNDLVDLVIEIRRLFGRARDDEARTPLIISGPAEQSTDLYYEVDKIIPRLKAGAVTRGDTKAEERDALELTGDYLVDEKHKTVTL